MIEVKLCRADLERGLDKQLFEISSKYFVDQALEFAEEKISCSLKSEKQWHGYRLTGEISIPFFETCDRCLVEFTDQHTAEFLILLTNDRELTGAEDDDVIWFGDAENTVDIGPVIRELVLVEEPFKTLCGADCKGICPLCGANRTPAPPQHAAILGGTHPPRAEVSVHRPTTAYETYFRLSS